MAISTCCGAETDMDEIGICPECMEHCDWEEEDEDEVEIAKDQKEQNELEEIMLREAEEKLHNQ
jgi:hypothetical protein